MEHWGKIVNLALLGTEKAKLEEKFFDANTSDAFEQIRQSSGNKEEEFLQAAALLSNYRRCGFIPMEGSKGLMTLAPEEERTYANTEAHTALEDILVSGNQALLHFWLKQCANTQQLIRPALLPDIIDIGNNQKQLRQMISACMGQRGKWLMQWNDSWQWSAPTSFDDVWENGSTSERKAVLAKIREQDAAKGLSLLMEIWSHENAASRAELLESLKTGAGIADLPWLEQVMEEKSVKVREVTMSILKTIPESTILLRYWAFLKESITIEQSKGLLGFGTKYSLAIHSKLQDPAKELPGIDSLSGKADMSDELYVISQCISHISPQLWTEHYGKDPVNFLELFRKNDKYRILVPAFARAAVTYRNQEWLRTIIQLDESNFYPESIFALPQRETENYFITFLQHEGEAPRVLQMLDQFKEEWSLGFTRELFKYTAKNPYQFHKGFYAEHADTIPLATVGELEKCTPREEHLRQSWIKNAETIESMLSLKARTVQAFRYS
jgi:hypothetical protein